MHRDTVSTGYYSRFPLCLNVTFCVYRSVKKFRPFSFDLSKKNITETAHEKRNVPEIDCMRSSLDLYRCIDINQLCYEAQT